MFGLKLNNQRSWFLEHKQEYEQLLWQPIKELSQEVFEQLNDKYPEKGFNLKLTRIYRDMRRPHPDGPYKTALWFTVRRELTDWVETPVFYFEINADSYSYGMGFYSANAATMERFRAGIDKAPAKLRRLAENMEADGRFSLRGAEYVRKKGEPGGVLDSWYNRKNVDLDCTREIDQIACSPRLVTELTEGYEFLMPFYEYFLPLCEPERRVPPASSL